jgi:hypothetical protein
VAAAKVVVAMMLVLMEHLLQAAVAVLDHLTTEVITPEVETAALE